MQQSTKANHKVLILCKSNKVVPGLLQVQPGDDVTFKALNGDVKIWFPVKDLFGVDSLQLKRGAPQTLTVQKKDSDEYPYSPYCLTTGTFAEGGSSPIIIIE
jgi:hypothetical protein